MKSWRIHLVWALFTVIVAASWGRYVSRPNRPEHRDRVRAPSVDADPALGGESDSVAVKAAAETTIRKDIPGIPAPPDSSWQQALTPEQIRVLLRDRRTWSTGFEAVKKQSDRRLKLGLLAECLTLSGVDVRIPVSAFMQLGEMGGPDAAELVEKSLRESPEDQVRMRAARTLGQIRETRSVAPLLEAYNSGPSELKLYCASALQKLGHAGPASEMLSTLSGSLDSPDGALRREALENVNTLELAASLPLLTRCLSDSNGDVRTEAISGLETLGMPESAGGKNLPEVQPLLERACQDPNPSVAEEARKALERLIKTRAGQKKP